MPLKLSFSRLMVSLSYCLDFVSHGLDRHHQRVTFTALALAETLGLPAADREDLFTAGIIHDAGASTWREKADLQQFDVDNPWDHCRRGARLFSRVSFLAPLAEIIFCHHDCWTGPNASRYAGSEIPLTSRILHLADRVDVLLHTGNTHVLQKREEVLDRLQALSGQTFDPELGNRLQGDSGQGEFLARPHLALYQGRVGHLSGRHGARSDAGRVAGSSPPLCRGR